ncbi:vWA domain-containing protein [Dongia rigui]|uniref:VWA domain-containing protein n=1 Tax=Dongia rigui TaxID=940149 RepID=A0ABU5E182_9PROT|nr:VWA domain-containing protein [Dongia rigui]MDY0872960.1 VWA domain-containing protein [Dongia rigui]
MRRQILITHILLSSALILNACGAENSQTADLQAAPKVKVTTESSSSDAATIAATGVTVPSAPAETRKVEPATTLGIAAEAVPGQSENFTSNIYPTQPANTENYAHNDDNPIKRTAEDAVSTFSIDVDTGSYANLRRFLMNGQKPPADAVRVEEMLNYFSYAYKGPRDASIPFRADADVMTTPWNPNTKLLRLAIKGYQPPLDHRPAANLVFLIDVSGSMQDQDKLPLLKAGMKMLVDQLGADDKVTIVTYAGSAGLALAPTSGNEKETIRAAIDGLEAGGSTAGGEGIALAYAKAREAKVDGGINRILLATDGDFNVGVTDIDALKDMIEENRKSGIALSTLGFGEGNYNDALMEQIADVGNGSYGHIDSLNEAKRQLVDGLQANIETIAKDVKVQIEFNPAIVAEYRLIGYENRALKREDFNNDQKDAGEIGAGHSVTALYEIALIGSKGLSVDPLRYQDEGTAKGVAGKAEEFAFLRIRYKAPGGDASKLIETPLPTAWLSRDKETTPDDNFAAAVAAFGQYLKGGDRLGQFDLGQIASLARSGRGEDASGERAEFINLVELTEALAPTQNR